MTLRVNLPSRYEDLDQAFRGRLKPVTPLIQLVRQAEAAMRISGGIRFMPIYGQSGSGKTSAVLELGTHLPEARVVKLGRDAVESRGALEETIRREWTKRRRPRAVVAVVDQYEESVATRGDIPTQFVETLSLVDRADPPLPPTLFIWLTTSRDFQQELATATTRNARILISGNFEVAGPSKAEWPDIIEETFEFHNREQALADFYVLNDDLEEIAWASGTLGQAIEEVGRRLGTQLSLLHDISDYEVVMLWPVTGTRIDRVASFTNVRDGYTLDWPAWFRSFEEADRTGLPFDAFNRARLYFDMRLVPIAVADLHRLCLTLEDDDYALAPSYLGRFSKSHFFSIISGTWDATGTSRLRARESQRSTDAAEWYETVTNQPVPLAKRIAKALRALDLDAEPEQSITAGAATVRTDIHVRNRPGLRSHGLVELKAFSTANTMPSTIRDAVRGTLRKYAQFAGFLPRQ